jgi:hypothetical protein
MLIVGNEVVSDDLKRGQVVCNKVIDILRSGRSILDQNSEDSKNRLN